MLQSILKIFVPILSLVFSSCGEKNPKNNKQSIRDTFDQRANTVSKDDSIGDNQAWLNPAKLTPFQFLELMRKKGNINDRLGVQVMTDSFSHNWVKDADVDSLISLVKSKDKCNCFLNPLSSYIPNDSADVGGYAITLIRAYRQKRKVSFGLHSCPKTTNLEAAELIDWWTQQ